MTISESNKHEIEGLLGMLDRRKREERLRYFKPTSADNCHNPQDKFLYSNAKIRAAFGGNRSGKTEIGAVDCIMACLGTHPTRPTKPPVYGRICAPQYQKNCKDVILKKFQQLVPLHELKGGSWDKAWKEMEKAMTFANGSKIHFMSGEQDISFYGGDDLDFFWIDEHLQEKFFIENMARITDRNGWGLITMTPEKGQTWEWDYVTGPPKGISVEHWFFDTDRNPYISEEGVATLKASIRNKALYAAKLHGLRYRR